MKVFFKLNNVHTCIFELKSNNMFNGFKFTETPFAENEYFEQVKSDLAASRLEGDASSLRGSSWVGSFTIDNYLNLIVQRSMKNKNLPTVCHVNVGFYENLLVNGFDKVNKRKNKDLFLKDLVFCKL